MAILCAVCGLVPQIKEYGSLLFYLVKFLISMALLAGLVASATALLAAVIIMLIARRVNS